MPRPTSRKDPSDPGVSSPGDLPIAGPPYGAAALVGALILALYATTLGPTTWFWDTSEYIATAHTLGIPHPPGNPLFVLIARAWELLLAPTGLSVPIRVNFFSAFMGAGAAALWFLVVNRILSSFTGRLAVRRVGSAVAALISATGYTVWSQSVVNEKVYTVSLFTIALLTWIGFCWRDRIDGRRQRLPTDKPAHLSNEDNALVLAIFVLALSVGNHLMAFLAAPALLLLVLLVKPRALLDWRLYAWSAAVALAGLSIHLYLPIRAALSPVINEANPVCQSLRDAVVSVGTLGRAGCEELSAALARKQYAKPPELFRLAPLSAQLANYLQYFDWQWSRSLMGTVGYFAPARLPVTLLFLGLGGYGAVCHRRRDRISFAYLGTLFATLSLGLVFYMNFKYGYGQAQALGLDPNLGEVRERDYFFLVSFSLWGLWAGIGITALWVRLADRFHGRSWALLRASPVLSLALIPLVLNIPYTSRSGDYSARDWAYNLLNSVEPYGVLITNGDNDTFPLWYLQEVEGLRKDVTVVVREYLKTPWYARQIRQLTTPCESRDTAATDPTRNICQRPFEPEKAAALYANVPVRSPTRTALPVSDVEIHDTTQSVYMRLSEDSAFQARGIQISLPAGTVLFAADQFILKMVQEAWTDRPIYFASTTNIHHDLKLAPFVARQGLAFKLLTPEETESEGLTRMPQDEMNSPIYGAYVDVPRTQELFWSAFIYRDILQKPHWTDDASRNIPSQYVFGHVSLARAEQELGQLALASRDLQAAVAWQDLSLR